MRIFIWKRVENLTNRYHSDGGAVVVAEDLGRAMQIWREMAERSERAAAKYEVLNHTHEIADALNELEPDIVLRVCDGCAGEMAIAFPNAGCC